MLECLTENLELHLHLAKKFGYTFDKFKDYASEAYGMVLMFCALCPDKCAEASELWEKKYKPLFMCAMAKVM